MCDYPLFLFIVYLQRGTPQESSSDLSQTEECSRRSRKKRRQGVQPPATLLPQPAKKCLASCRRPRRCAQGEAILQHWPVRGGGSGGGDPWAARAKTRSRAAMASLSCRYTPWEPAPSPPLLPLVGVADQLEQVGPERGVVARGEAPALGLPDRRELPAAEARAPQVQARRVAERRQLHRVHRALGRHPRRHRLLRAPLQRARHTVRVRQRHQRRPVLRQRRLLPLRRRRRRPPARHHTAAHVNFPFA